MGQLRLPLFFAGAQQNDQCALATVVRQRLAVGQCFLALGQPAAYQLAQYGKLLWRAMPFAMDDPYAALTMMQALGQEGRQLVPCFLPVQAMQVEFGLYDPAPAP